MSDDQVPNNSSLLDPTEWHRSVLENALDAVIAIDEEQTVQEWNLHAEQIFGWSKKEAIGRPLASLIIPEEYRAAHHAGFGHFLKTGHGPILFKRIEVMASHRSGQIFPVELTVIPVRRAGKYWFYSFVRDVTDRTQKNSDYRFLTELSFQLATTENNSEIKRTTFKSLAEYLKATRCWLSQIDAETRIAKVADDYCLGRPSLAGVYPLDVFGPEMVESWFSGRVVHVSDVVSDPRTHHEAKNHLALGIRSFITVPLHRGGRIVAAINLAVENSRIWQAREIDLVRTVSESLWSVLENGQLVEALQKSEFLLRTLTNALPAFVSYVDTDCRYQFANKAYEIAFNRPLHEIKGRHIREIAGEDRWKAIEPSIQRALGGEPADSLSLMKIQGERKMIQGNYVPDFDHQQTVCGLVILGTDVTQLKTTESELKLALDNERHARHEAELANVRMQLLARLSAELLEKLDFDETLHAVGTHVTSSIADWCAIQILDKEGHTQRLQVTHSDAGTGANVKVYLESEDFKTTPLGQHSVFVTGQTEIFASHGAGDFDTQESTPTDFKNQNSRLSARTEVTPTSAIVAPLSTRGKVFGAIIFAQLDGAKTYTQSDAFIAEEVARRAGLAIENARLYRASQDAIRARDEFLSICSHELKTPVTALKLQFESAARRIRKGDQRVYSVESVDTRIRDTTRQLDRLTRLIDDMLDVSKSAGRRLDFSFESVELTALIADVVSQFQDQLEATGAVITVKARDEVKVECDRFRIEQVITNLLSNAIKYGNHSAVEVLIRQSDTHAVISVKDSGIGIPPHSLEKIFQRFERAIPPTHISGLGLGLYISRYIVNEHRGRIWAESKNENGAIFFVELPKTQEIFGQAVAPYKDEQKN